MKSELTRCWMRWILELLILYWATNVLILQFAGNTRQVELQSACSLMLVALSVLDLLLPRHYMMSYTHTHTHCTLKSPLSMMSMILYCWLMSFSSTRFLSAFSWSFLLVSNSRLSDRRRSGGQTLSTSRETHPWRCLSSTLSDLHTHTHRHQRTAFGGSSARRQQKDTDLQVGVVSRSVCVGVCRAECGSGERQDHCTHTPHGQQGVAERHSSENRDDEPSDIVPQQNIVTQSPD